MRFVRLSGFALLALVTPALAAPGDLDPTFGIGGVVLEKWIALDPPTAESGACVVSPPVTSCALDATGNKLRCE